MYGNELMAQKTAGGMCIAKEDYNPTVRENIDTRINVLKAEIARLEASKESLTPLLEMRIRDIRDAMSY